MVEIILNTNEAAIQIITNDYKCILYNLGFTVEELFTKFFFYIFIGRKHSLVQKLMLQKFRWKKIVHVGILLFDEP